LALPAMRRKTSVRPRAAEVWKCGMKSEETARSFTGAHVRIVLAIDYRQEGVAIQERSNAAG